METLVHPLIEENWQTHRDKFISNDNKLWDGVVALENKTSNINNTSDANKPLSNAQIAAIELAKDRENHIGQQTTASIADLTEYIQDVIAGFLGAGSNIILNYNDAANTFTVGTTISGGTSGLDAEGMRDALGIALVGVGNIAVTVNDANDTITITTTATQNSTDAALRDRNLHTGKQSADTITETEAKKFLTSAERQKIANALTTADTQEVSTLSTTSGIDSTEILVLEGGSLKRFSSKSAFLAWAGISSTPASSAPEWDYVQRFMTVAANKVEGSMFLAAANGGTLTPTTVTGIPLILLNLQTLTGAASKPLFMTSPNLCLQQGYTYTIEFQGVRFPVGNNGTDNYITSHGFTDANGSTGETVDGVFFRVSPDNAFLQMCTASNAAADRSTGVTTVDTDIAYAPNVSYKLKAVVDFKAASPVAHFYVNDILKSGSGITTNIPHTAIARSTGMGMFIMKVLGTGNVNINCSQIAYSIR